jgi:Tat protein secretion system quality control protein TatD with DNase activity
VAEARGQSVDHVAQITTENATRFFGLPPSE